MRFAWSVTGGVDGKRGGTAVSGGGGIIADPAAGVTRLAVVGAGLVGGSVARAAMDAGVERVVLTDADPRVRERARALGLAHEVTDDPGEAVADVDLVLIATPASTVATVIQELVDRIPTQAIITDVSSLKSELVPEVEAMLDGFGANPTRFVGGHPMAGSERSGPDAADGQLFQGATWVLTPTAATEIEALQRLSGFLGRLGARVLAVSPDRHDALVAVVSHLPQVAASCLADVAADAVATSGQAVLAVAGGGFRDTTRVAASDPDLWVGILEGNRVAVLDALDRYLERLERLRLALDVGDRAGLRDALARASEARRQLVPKVGPERVVDLVVPLDDRPGALATATTALGEAGVNVEDLAMRHAVEGDRGALLVRVDAAAAPQGLQALERRGLRAHLQGDEPPTAPLPPIPPGRGGPDQATRGGQVPGPGPASGRAPSESRRDPRRGTD